MCEREASKSCDIEREITCICKEWESATNRKTVYAHVCVRVSV